MVIKEKISEMRHGNINVSVIIPVYNAAKFVGEAVYSVVNQKHVAEVLLVEDGSKDGSLSICRGLEDANAKVRILQHENGRNFGVQQSELNFIAFLDADDIPLPNRFDLPLQILTNTTKWAVFMR